MARPARNNVDYFPFYCEEGKKMFYLEETYGNDGFATFVKLLRELAKTDFHYLDLSKNATMMFLAAKCKVSISTLNSIIKDLVILEKFDAELWNENKIIWCQDFIDSIQDAYTKRSGDCIDRNSLLLLLSSKGVRKLDKSSNKPSLGVQSTGINPQRKEKEIKVEDIKVEEKQNFNHAAFLEFWNLSFKDKKIPKLNSVTESRKKAIDKLLKIYSKKDLENTIKKIAESDFANGKNKNNWVMTFDFLIKPDNFTKAMEGNYDNAKIQLSPTFVTNR